MVRSRSSILAISLALPLALGGMASAARAAAPATWDNLVKVPSKKIQAVYIAQGVDFRPYQKVMLDPVEIAFEKDWRRNYNNSQRGTQMKVSDSDLERTISEASKGAGEIFASELAKGGYQVVTEAGPDVLRLRIGIVDIYVAAPDVMAPGRSRTFSSEAGYATLIVEARDSVGGAVLGRAVDRETAGDTGGWMMSRSSVSNRGDFQRIATSWAKAIVRGMNELKSRSTGAGE